VKGPKPALVVEHAENINRLCGEFLSASPPLWTFSSESVQVDCVTRFVASGKELMLAI